MRLSALIASAAANVIRLRLGDEGSGTITVAAAADVGEAQTEVEAAIEGDTVQIAFNARYLQEALQNLDQEQLALEFSGPLSPGVSRPMTRITSTSSCPSARRPRPAPAAVTAGISADACQPTVARRLPELRRLGGRLSSRSASRSGR